MRSPGCGMKFIIIAGEPHNIAPHSLSSAIFAIACEPSSPMIDA
jgi:hypothetical protein